MIDDYDDEDFYDTGPFCRHWSHPSDCPIVCANCGHKCSEHYGEGCDARQCYHFVDGDSPPIKPQ